MFSFGIELRRAADANPSIGHHDHRAGDGVQFEACKSRSCKLQIRVKTFAGGAQQNHSRMTPWWVAPQIAKVFVFRHDPSPFGLNAPPEIAVR